MKKLVAISFFLIAGLNGFAQQFQKQFEIQLPDTIQTSTPTWVDLDNDGLLDVLLVSKAQSAKNYFQFIKGDTVATPVLHAKKESVISINCLMLMDYNHDNRMDVVVSGEKNGVPTTAVYINLGSFDFEEKVITAPSFSSIKSADLDNDARPEWIVSGIDAGNFHLRILKQESELVWKVAHDTLLINVMSMEIIDGNVDGRQDIFFSGITAPNLPTSGFLINQGGLYFKSYLPSQRVGATSSGDFNSDGTFDVMLMSKGNNGALQSTLYESASGIYNAKSYPITLHEPRLFAADFNSDGALDMHYLGKNNVGDTSNIIQYGVDSVILGSRKLISQQFGDVEHDGDLDLVQVVENDPISLIFYENRPAQKNLAPGIPKKGIAVSVYDRVFVYWEKTTDDHTPSASLTYDLHLEGNPLYQAGSFDFLNQRRLNVSHGNNGTDNFRLLKDVSIAGLNFSVQAVDNSLHAGALCIGGSVTCANVQTEILEACSKEQFTLPSPPDALWFSFSKGFLGMHDEYDLQVIGQDTVFYFDPAKTGCSALKAWTIKINNDTTKVQLSDKYACMDSQIQFTAEPGWSNIQWTSQSKGNLGTSSSISYTATGPDSVFVTMSNPEGCKLTRKTAVKISQPQIEVTDDNYKILKGEEVQLSASGAATYAWTPASGLSSVNVPNPIASPGTTTLYTVTGYDSLGCTDQTNVNVIVEGAGFIPNLFTPNDDGKNDELKLYGMPAVKDFVFSIYNREGSQVYRTTDVSDAMARGWDGTRSGTKQPPGVYYWKVKGEVSSGDRILLNGKDAGSIVLVR
jgi:gliding motility-associated-like protein